MTLRGLLHRRSCTTWLLYSFSRYLSLSTSDALSRCFCSGSQSVFPRAQVFLLARETILVYRWKERRVRGTRRCLPLPLCMRVALFRFLPPTWSLVRHPLCFCFFFFFFFFSFVIVIVIVVFVVVVLLPVAPLLALFRIQGSRAPAPSQWTHDTRKPRMRRWKATGFFHTQTSVDNCRHGYVSPACARARRQGNERESEGTSSLHASLEQNGQVKQWISQLCVRTNFRQRALCIAVLIRRDTRALVRPSIQTRATKIRLVCTGQSSLFLFPPFFRSLFLCLPLFPSFPVYLGGDGAYASPRTYIARSPREEKLGRRTYVRRRIDCRNLVKRTKP